MHERKATGRRSLARPSVLLIALGIAGVLAGVQLFGQPPDARPRLADPSGTDLRVVIESSDECGTNDTVVRVLNRGASSRDGVWVRLAFSQTPSEVAASAGTQWRPGALKWFVNGLDAGADATLTLRWAALAEDVQVTASLFDAGALTAIVGPSSAPTIAATLVPDQVEVAAGTIAVDALTLTATGRGACAGAVVVTPEDGLTVTPGSLSVEADSPGVALTLDATAAPPGDYAVRVRLADGTETAPVTVRVGAPNLVIGFEDVYGPVCAGPRPVNAVVTNTGDSTLGPVDVAIATDDLPAATTRITGLAPGASERIPVEVSFSDDTAELRATATSDGATAAEERVLDRVLLRPSLSGPARPAEPGVPVRLTATVAEPPCLTVTGALTSTPLDGLGIDRPTPTLVGFAETGDAGEIAFDVEVTPTADGRWDVTFAVDALGERSRPFTIDTGDPLPRLDIAWTPTDDIRVECTTAATTRVVVTDSEGNPLDDAMIRVRTPGGITVSDEAPRSGDTITVRADQARSIEGTVVADASHPDHRRATAELRVRFAFPAGNPALSFGADRISLDAGRAFADAAELTATGLPCSGTTEIEIVGPPELGVTPTTWTPTPTSDSVTIAISDCPIGEHVVVARLPDGSTRSIDIECVATAQLEVTLTANDCAGSIGRSIIVRVENTGPAVFAGDLDLRLVPIFGTFRDETAPVLWTTDGLDAGQSVDVPLLVDFDEGQEVLWLWRGQPSATTVDGRAVDVRVVYGSLFEGTALARIPHALTVSPDPLEVALGDTGALAVDLDTVPCAGPVVVTIDDPPEATTNPPTIELGAGAAMTVDVTGAVAGGPYPIEMIADGIDTTTIGVIVTDGPVPRILVTSTPPPCPADPVRVTISVTGEAGDADVVWRLPDGVEPDGETRTADGVQLTIPTEGLDGLTLEARLDGDGGARPVARTFSRGSGGIDISPLDDCVPGSLVYVLDAEARGDYEASLEALGCDALSPTDGGGAEDDGDGDMKPSYLLVLCGDPGATATVSVVLTTSAGSIRPRSNVCEISEQRAGRTTLSCELTEGAAAVPFDLEGATDGIVSARLTGAQSGPAFDVEFLARRDTDRSPLGQAADFAHRNRDWLFLLALPASAVLGLAALRPREVEPHG